MRTRMGTTYHDRCRRSTPPGAGPVGERLYTFTGRIIMILTMSSRVLALALLVPLTASCAIMRGSKKKACRRRTPRRETGPACGRRAGPGCRRGERAGGFRGARRGRGGSRRWRPPADADAEDAEDAEEDADEEELHPSSVSATTSMPRPSAPGGPSSITSATAPTR